MTDLEIFYGYYRHLLCTIDENPPKYNDKGEKITISSEMYKFLVDYYGFNKMPKMVSDKHFNFIPKKKLYRGYKEYDHGANALVHFDYHYGMGYTHGIFLTENPEYALRFTRSGLKTEADKGKVLTCKVNSDNFETLTNIIALRKCRRDTIPEDCKYKDKIIELLNFRDKLYEHGDKNVAYGFMECMRNYSNFAVYLGIDYLLEVRTKHRIIFNRAKIVAPESEFLKFCSCSAHYKDGSFDFHDRTENLDNNSKS